MSRVCPKPCGRLATAALFIAVGVVQLLVGVILLRSKYAELLSAPDFMTATTNIVVGCLYGIAASIWKSNRKTTVKSSARRNVMASLLISVITVNTTASIVLIMSDGNKLLTLNYFESNSNYVSPAFTKEIITFAYVTSVCSPIVCVVIGLVALSGNCSQRYQAESQPNMDDSVKKPLNLHGWVFEPRSHSDPNFINDFLQTPSPSINPQSSISGNSVFSSNGDSSVKRKSFLSVKSIPSPVHTWKKKRARILRDDSLSRKRSLLHDCLQNPYFCDGSHEGLIPRIKESSIIKKQDLNIENNDDIPQYNRNRWSMENKLSNSSSCQPGSDETDFKSIRSSSYTNAILEGNKSNYETRLERKCIGSTNKDVNTESLENTKDKNQVTRSLEHLRSHNCSVGNAFKKGISESDDNRVNVYKDETQFEDSEILRLKAQTLQELKKRVSKGLPTAKAIVIRGERFEPVSFNQSEERSDLSISIAKRNQKEFVDGSSQSRENFSPDGVFERKPETNAEEVDNSTIESLPFDESHNCSPISTRTSLRSNEAIGLQNSKKMDPEMNAIRGILKSKVLDLSHSEIEFQTSEGDVLSHDGNKKIRNIALDCPKVAALKLQNKKREVARKMSSMASIAEMSSEEGSDGICFEQSSSAEISKRTTSLNEDLRNVDENANITVHSSPSSRSVVSKTSAVRKSNSFSPKSILKRIWNSSGSPAKFNVSDLIVDEDSLIGLSEEELIARTLRIRSLSQVVEERLRKEIATRNHDNHVTP